MGTGFGHMSVLGCNLDLEILVFIPTDVESGCTFQCKGMHCQIVRMQFLYTLHRPLHIV